MSRLLDRNDLVIDAPTPHDRAILDLFVMISRIPHPTGREAALRDRLIAMTDAVRNEFGSQAARHEVDAKGNLRIVLSGTGRYAGMIRPVAALQGHLDMVLAVAGAPAGSTIDALLPN